LRQSLTKTRQGFLARLQSAWGSGKDLEARLAELEEALITADIGVKATHALLAKLRPRAGELPDADSLRRALSDDMRAVLADGEPPAPAEKPYVILVAGVNGVGKTTTIGKLAHRYRQAGKTVLLVAADTFRAAAIEQIEHWANRVGADCVRHQSGSDPAAVAHDGVSAAVARGVDVVIVDTAGRLHVKQHLIEELKKVVRVIGRQLPGAPHEVLLVIDATTGQNAISQARVFFEALNVTGIVLTKLDGTAKGGAIFAVRSELGVPIRYIGLGESPDDLAPFDPDAFVDALLATP
jgi:fused signal recognition particle receptor